MGRGIEKKFASRVMGWDGMRDRNFLASRVIAGCGMRIVRDGMCCVMEKRPRDGPIYNPGQQALSPVKWQGQ